MYDALASVLLGDNTRKLSSRGWVNDQLMMKPSGVPMLRYFCGMVNDLERTWIASWYHNIEAEAQSKIIV